MNSLRKEVWAQMFADYGVPANIGPRHVQQFLGPEAFANLRLLAAPLVFRGLWEPIFLFGEPLDKYTLKRVA